MTHSTAITVQERQAGSSRALLCGRGKAYTVGEERSVHGLHTLWEKHGENRASVSFLPPKVLCSIVKIEAED